MTPGDFAMATKDLTGTPNYLIRLQDVQFPNDQSYKSNKNEGGESRVTSGFGS